MLTIKVLNKPFAAEIHGVDVSKPVSPELFAKIQEVWTRHPLIVFRNPDLTEEAHQAFSSQFGELAARARPAEVRGTRVRENPYLMLVSNIRENGELIGSSGEGELVFHSDGVFNEIPSTTSLLYGIEIPSEGGDTLFVDMNVVYESLDARIKQIIADKEAVNYHSVYRENENGKGIAERSKKVRHAVHPMVTQHPVSGKPILFVNELNTREIVGMSPDKATELLSSLFAKTSNREGIYAHKWQRGDLVVWDNRCLQHGRSDWEPRERRLLRRFAVKATERPRSYFQVVTQLATGQ